MSIARQLLAWYDEYKRDLPWRRDKDPYKIWVSEIMLQQTRVEAVKSYFTNWIEKFPTLDSLADANEEEVIQAWQGLGYYSRARNLLRGVQEVKAEYGGNVPQNKAEILGLAGIGDYTAGAILSIAYNQKQPAIDGNVLRVFSRLYCIEQDITLAVVKKQIRDLVEQEISATYPGNFNQALMDLGATICIPKSPRCEICPLITHCCAQAKGCEKQLPVKKKKVAPLQVRVIAAVLQDGDCFLLRRRPKQGLLAGMWEFPAIEMQAGEDEQAVFEQKFLADTGQEIEQVDLLFQCTHIFSHRQWDISFYRCASRVKQVPTDDNLCWINKKDWHTLSFAGPHRKMAKYLLE